MIYEYYKYKILIKIKETKVIGIKGFISLISIKLWENIKILMYIKYIQ